MATLTRISGFLYNALGQVVQQGKLSVTLQQDMVSTDGTKVAPLTVSSDLSQNGGLVDLSLYATVGASPAGLTYFVEFDPDPVDVTKPARTKNGYWSNYWAVPRTDSVPLGNFTSAARGEPSANYMPVGGASPVADALLLGSAPSATTKSIRANMLDGVVPEIRFNPVTSIWEFSNDGVTFAEMGSGGGFDGGDLDAANGHFTGIVSASGGFSGTGSGLTNLNASSLGSGTLPDARFPAILPAVSGQRLTNLSAANLTSGVLAAARLPAITDSMIDALAAIAWTKINKTGSSLADLATRSAADLNAGILAIARGGTGGTNVPTQNGVAYGTGSALAYTAAGSVGQIMKVGSAGLPEWGDPGAAAGHALLSSVHSDVTAAAVTRGAIIAGIGVNPSWTLVPLGVQGQFLRSNGTEPAWSSDGSALTNLNATNLASGFVPDARLSPTILRGDAANVFSQLQTYDAGLRLKNNQSLTGKSIDGASFYQLTKVDGNNQVIFGSTIAPSIFRSNCNRPDVIQDKDVWIEVTGNSPTRTIAIMYMDGSTPRPMASITI